MRRNLLSLSLLTILLSSVLIFQNCGKGSNTKNTTTTVQGSFDNQSDLGGSADKVTPDEEAQLLYRRLAGVALDPDSKDAADMVNYINGGHPEKAAAIATAAGTFYTLTVRDFAGKMSWREATVLAPLSDFVATIIGVVRDETPATELLTGNFYYRVTKTAKVSDDVLNAIVTTNAHYEQLETNYPDTYWSLLEREEGQKFLAANGSVVVHDDPAGLLTTRAWLMSQTFAGTNRRVIEQTMKMFECTTIDQWASTSNSDDHVGRDIGRFPSDDYNNKCKGCHTGMDGMRPASAYYDFFMTDQPHKAGYVKYKYTYAQDDDPNGGTTKINVPADEQLVPAKFRRGADTYPEGFVVKDNEWINYADPNVFGWTFTTGKGMNDLGNMMAYSAGFPRCMVKRVFSSVCKQDLTAQDSKLINKLAGDFKYDNYNLKNLFIKVALRPECMGLEAPQ